MLALLRALVLSSEQVSSMPTVLAIVLFALVISLFRQAAAQAKNRKKTEMLLLRMHRVRERSSNTVQPRGRGT